MELGPLQNKWVADLREHADRQTDGCLGYIGNDGEMHLCCLGQALITMKESEGGNPIDVFVDDEESESYSLFDGVSDSELDESWEKLGLYDQDGGFVNRDKFKDQYDSLIDMNDQGITWPEIADFIEENPEMVFAEPK